MKVFPLKVPAPVHFCLIYWHWNKIHIDQQLSRQTRSESSLSSHIALTSTIYKQFTFYDTHLTIRWHKKTHNTYISWIMDSIDSLRSREWISLCSEDPHDIDVYILSLWGEFIQVYVSGQKGFYFECQSKQNLRKVNLLSNSIWIAFIAQAEHHTYNTIQSTTANTYTLAHTIWILENKSFWTFVFPSNI